jgi:hypothetical protein
MRVQDLIRLPDPRADVRIAVREVVRDVFGRPHVFVRVRLTGWRFPHRAAEPFLVVGDVVSRMVYIDADGLSASAYFDQPIPAARRVSFGYGRTIHWDFDLPVEPRRMERLDRARLPPDTHDLQQHPD